MMFNFFTGLISKVSPFKGYAMMIAALATVIYIGYLLLQNAELEKEVLKQQIKVVQLEANNEDFARANDNWQQSFKELQSLVEVQNNTINNWQIATDQANARYEAANKKYQAILGQGQANLKRLESVNFEGKTCEQSVEYVVTLLRGGKLNEDNPAVNYQRLHHELMRMHGKDHKH